MTGVNEEQGVALAALHQIADRHLLEGLMDLLELRVLRLEFRAEQTGVGINGNESRRAAGFLGVTLQCGKRDACAAALADLHHG